MNLPAAAAAVLAATLLLHRVIVFGDAFQFQRRGFQPATSLTVTRTNTLCIMRPGVSAHSSSLRGDKHARHFATSLGEETPSSAAVDGIISTSTPTYPPTPTLRECFSFALPALGIYACPPLMSLIDASFIGRSSSIELAALGPASSISDSSALPLLFLSIAATNLVAQSYSAGDGVACAKISRTTLSLGAIGGTALAAVLYRMAGPLSFLYCGGGGAAATTATVQTLAPLCSRYVTIRALALPAVVVATIAQAVCIGIRDTRTPMIAVALAGGLNLIGDLILVTGLRKGIAGAAWATTLSQFAAASLLLRVLQKRGLLRQNRPSAANAAAAADNTMDGIPCIDASCTSSSDDGDDAQQTIGNEGSNEDRYISTRGTIMHLLSFVPFLFVMGVKIGMHNSCAATAASLGGAPAAAHTALFAVAMLCFTFGDVGSSLSQAFLPAFATTVVAAADIDDDESVALLGDKDNEVAATLVTGGGNGKSNSPSFDTAAAIPTIKQLLKCTFTISATVVGLASALLTIFSGQITRDPDVIRQMRATLPLMIATLSLHGTAVTLEGLLLARKNFRGLSLTYAGVGISVAVLLALVQHFSVGLLGVWGVYIWFQISRVVSFSAIGGLLTPRRWRKRRRTSQKAAASISF